ncbi:MAG: ABC transporter substrate-binding protein [Ignavibacteriales bacterium]|nr:ABC transporter substrate-binding protein [Ignavibacteriales bacterium]
MNHVFFSLLHNRLRKRLSHFLSRSDSLALFSALAIAIAGCGKETSSGNKVVITFWHSYVSSTVPALNELLAKFQEEHPNIEVRAQYVPTGDALIQKIVTAVQSKTAPDVSWIHSNFLPDLVQSGAIYRMDEFMTGPQSLSKEDLDDIFPALLQQARWRDTLYSMPMEATCIGLLYNKELFRKSGLDPDKPPATWEELRQTAKKLTLDEDGDGKNEQAGFFVPVFPASGPWGDWMVWQWYAFLFQAGGDVINANQTKMLFDSEAGVQALSLWKNIYSELKLARFTIDYEVAFASKQLAMALDGPWNIPRWSKFKNLDWMIAPLPAGPAKRATVAGGEYLAIFRQSEHPKEAWEFVKWVIRPEIQAFWSMKSGYLPVRRSVHDVKEYQEYLNANPALKAYVDQLEVGQTASPIDYNSLKISRNIADAIERATLGGNDPRTELAQAAAKSNTLLRSPPTH